MGPSKIRLRKRSIAPYYSNTKRVTRSMTSETQEKRINYNENKKDSDFEQSSSSSSSSSSRPPPRKSPRIQTGKRNNSGKTSSSVPESQAENQGEVHEEEEEDMSKEKVVRRKNPSRLAKTKTAVKMAGPVKTSLQKMDMDCGEELTPPKKKPRMQLAKKKNQGKNQGEVRSEEEDDMTNEEVVVPKRKLVNKRNCVKTSNSKSTKLEPKVDAKREAHVDEEDDISLNSETEEVELPRKKLIKKKSTVECNSSKFTLLQPPVDGKREAHVDEEDVISLISETEEVELPKKKTVTFNGSKFILLEPPVDAKREGLVGEEDDVISLISETEEVELPRKKLIKKKSSVECNSSKFTLLEPPVDGKREAHVDEEDDISLISETEEVTPPCGSDQKLAKENNSSLLESQVENQREVLPKDEDDMSNEEVVVPRRKLIKKKKNSVKSNSSKSTLLEPQIDAKREAHVDEEVISLMSETEEVAQPSGSAQKLAKENNSSLLEPQVERQDESHIEQVDNMDTEEALEIPKSVTKKLTKTKNPAKPNIDLFVRQTGAQCITLIEELHDTDSEQELPQPKRKLRKLRNKTGQNTVNHKDQINAQIEAGIEKIGKLRLNGKREASPASSLSSHSSEVAQFSSSFSAAGKDTSFRVQTKVSKHRGRNPNTKKPKKGNQTKVHPRRRSSASSVRMPTPFENVSDENWADESSSSSMNATYEPMPTANNSMVAYSAQSHPQSNPTPSAETVHKALRSAIELKILPPNNTSAQFLLQCLIRLFEKCGDNGSLSPSMISCWHACRILKSYLNFN